jgi:4-hydroxy-tetrahydrodipicolinate synthase
VLSGSSVGHKEGVISLKPEGLIVPLITPLYPDETLDEASLERLVEHVITGGVDSIFVLGSCGEFPGLDDATRERLLQAVCEQARGRVSVLVGISEAGTRRTIERGKQLARLGIDAVVATAPFYYVHTQEELVTHFTAIAHAVDAPVVIYNIPQMVKVSIETETVRQLAEVSGIIGLKDSAENMIKFQEFLSLRAAHPDFRVCQGAELLTAASLVQGADGAVLGLANVAPRLCHDLCDAAESGNLPQAWALQKQLRQLYPIYEQGETWLAGLKAAVSELGLCGPTATAPFRPLTDAQRGRLRQILMELELM